MTIQDLLEQIKTSQLPLFRYLRMARDDFFTFFYMTCGFVLASSFTYNEYLFFVTFFFLVFQLFNVYSAKKS